MEHVRSAGTWEVLVRFLRRYWRFPAQVVGVLGVLALLLLALPFLPRGSVQVEASSADPGTGATGSVESLYAKGVGAPFDGQVAAALVEPGQSVKKGDLLFKLDASGLQSQLAAAHGAVAAAKQNLAQLQQMRREHLQPLEAQVSELKAQLAAEEASVSAPALALVGDPAAQEFVIETVETDPGRMEAIRTALTAATAQYQEARRQWGPALRDAQEQIAAASAEVKRIRGLIAAAERRSPIDGVVTRVDVRPGQWARAGQTLVRVDRPDGYRMVALVDKETRDALEKGDTLPVSVGGLTHEARLEKVVAGWDKDLYYYWLWLKPTQPEKLRPGQPVTVSLEPASALAPSGEATVSP